MTTHKTAALKVLFLRYTLKTSPTGEYYVFDVVDENGSHDICRVDSIHRSKIAWIFEALDRDETISAPVIRDAKVGYRIDLTAVAEINEQKFGKPQPILPPRNPNKGKTRVQFNIEPWKHSFIEKLAAAEGYENYSDWLRGIVDRVIETAQKRGEEE